MKQNQQTYHVMKDTLLFGPSTSPTTHSEEDPASSASNARGTNIPLLDVGYAVHAMKQCAKIVKKKDKIKKVIEQEKSLRKVD